MGTALTGQFNDILLFLSLPLEAVADSIELITTGQPQFP